MSRVATNGVTLHVQQLGATGRPAQPTIVLLHGIATDSLASWYFTVGKPLADAGLRVVMYDLRGHGRSERPPTGYRLEEFVGDLAELLPALDIAEPVYLLGNSFGGTIGYSYAVEFPDRVAGLAVIESEPATAGWAAKMAANLTRAREQLPHSEAIAWIRLRYGAHTARLASGAGRMLTATSMATDIPASRLPHTAQVAGLTCPVLSIYGAESDLAEQAPLVERLLPRARSVIVPGQEHSVLVERPEEVSALVLSWLADLGVPVGAPDAVAAESR
jgi:pimeloyl-ACP methyl ester carboxylesterase